ncbi:polar amino acid transport system substrate-binding protein [Halomonas korlensis]|uniref:Polar amino acid transport system substrate-binding protein n=1 Tax=Halomonas korlensis TaxID=463301 RepID=A0A1I7IAT6_9GAMM|nr:polar amino acid transport system substrate-binding protein [Halomonas korlensis]
MQIRRSEQGLRNGGWGWAGRLLIVAVPALAGCGFPNDIEHTTEKIRGGVLNVGLAENPPWVIRTDAGPAGLEPEIIQELAEELNAEIEWHWDSDSNLLAALQHGQLDLVACGFTENSRLSTFAASTKPYYASRYTVGVPKGEELPASLENLKVAMHPVGHFNKPLRDEGARPVQEANLAGTDGAVAAPSWWLRAHGFEPGDWQLATDKHVIALPKGENAWMMTMQRHLNGYDNIGQRFGLGSHPATLFRELLYSSPEGVFADIQRTAGFGNRIALVKHQTGRFLLELRCKRSSFPGH